MRLGSGWGYDQGNITTVEARSQAGLCLDKGQVRLKLRLQPCRVGFQSGRGSVRHPSIQTFSEAGIFRRLEFWHSDKPTLLWPDDTTNKLLSSDLTTLNLTFWHSDNIQTHRDTHTRHPHPHRQSDDIDRYIRHADTCGKSWRLSKR